MKQLSRRQLIKNGTFAMIGTPMLSLHEFSVNTDLKNKDVRPVIVNGDPDVVFLYHFVEYRH